METLIPIFALFILVAVGARLFAGSLDGGRIESYMKSRRWKLVDHRWAPMGPGWFGNQHQRIYEVDYRDEEGCLHRAHVQTSMFSGVYLTNDQILEDAVAAGQKGPDQDSLQEENERLRRRVAELEERPGP